MRIRIRIMSVLCAVVLIAGNVITVNAAGPVSVDITHTHSGNESEGGGCYVAQTHTHSGNESEGGDCYVQQTVNYGVRQVVSWQGCSGTVTGWEKDYQGIWHPKLTCGHNCNSGLCRAASSMPSTGMQCGYQSITDTYNVCNKCGSRNCNGTHQEWVLSCGKSEGDFEKWVLGCGLSTSSVVGTLSIQPSTTGSAQSVTLTASLSGCTNNGISWSTGASGDSITVTDNGTYSCTVNYQEGTVTGSKTLSISVDNIVKPEPPAPAPAPQAPSAPSVPASTTPTITEPEAEPEPTEEPKAEPEKKPEEKPEKEAKPEKKEEKPEPVPETEPVKETKPAEAQKPVLKPALPEEKESTPEVVEILDEETPKSSLQLATTVASTTTATSGMIWIIFCFFYRKCKVVDTETGQLIGKAYISKQQNYYVVKISNKIQQGCGNQISLLFNKHFVDQNEGKRLHVLIGDYEYNYKISESVDLKIEEI